jgi:hypothetical protein
MIVCMPELSVSNVYPIETAGTHDVLIIHSDILSSSDIYTFAVSNVYPIETAGKNIPVFFPVASLLLFICKYLSLSLVSLSSQRTYNTSIVHTLIMIYLIVILVYVATTLSYVVIYRL